MTTSAPIPGTTIKIEQDRQKFLEKRMSSLHNALDDIKARHDLKLKGRTREASITTRVKVQATVGLKLEKG